MNLGDTSIPMYEFDAEAYQSVDIFSWSEERIKEFQSKYIVQMFQHHYKNSDTYRKFCENCNISLDDIKGEEDIWKIPQIPSAIFKSIDVTSVPMEKIVKHCTSSGTQGLVSNIYRDEITLDHLLDSIQLAIRELYDMDFKTIQVINLGPDTEEASDIWFAYITSILNLIQESDNYLSHGALRNEDLYNKIKNLQGKKRLLILGAPPLFVKFTEYLRENNLELNLAKGDVVMTAGGWKKHTGMAIDKESFGDLIQKYFNIERTGIVDTFNQVELNTVVFQCEEGYKHMPPWVKVIVRDPVTLEDVGYDKLGILSYYDASANSYSCFLLSDDLGIKRKQCK